MTRRMIGWLTAVFEDRYTEPEPHFHSGPEGSPVVCYDHHCGSPHLSA